MPTSSSPPPNPARRALALLLAINLFNYLDRQILAAVEPLISGEFFPGAGETAMAKTGSLATAFLLSYMLLAPVFGWLADRYSRWHIIAAGVALWSLASGWSGLAGSFAVLLITRAFVGVGEAAYGPAAPTVISDMYAVEKRGRVLALFYLAIPVGSALGFVFGGAVGQRLGWRWPFYLVTLPGLLLAVLCLFMRDPRGVRDRGEIAPAKPRLTFSDIVALFRIRSFAMNTAAMTAMTFAIGGMSFWIPRYMSARLALSRGFDPRALTDEMRRQLTGEVGQTFGVIVVLAGILSTFLGGWLGDKLRARFPSSYFLVSGGAILLAFPATIAMLHTPFPGTWVCVFVAVFFLFFNTGPANAALANVTPPAVRATAFAVNIFMIHAFGDAISPPLIGWIAGRTNMDVAFITVSLTMVLASAFWFIGARYLGRDTAAVSAEEMRVPA